MSPPPPFADPVDPTRVRTLPRHFAWIDHRLRDRLRELSLEEIASMLNVPVGTIKSRSNRARLELARKVLALGGGYKSGTPS